MKILFIMAAVILSIGVQAAEKVRKVSNSNYYVCDIERENVLNKSFKRQYIFPYPTEIGEVHEIKASMRWNHIVVTFDHRGKVSTVISEKVDGKLIEGKKMIILDKDPQFESFKMIVELKSSVSIPYTISCRPE